MKNRQYKPLETFVCHEAGYIIHLAQVAQQK